MIPGDLDTLIEAKFWETCIGVDESDPRSELGAANDEPHGMEGEVGKAGRVGAGGEVRGAGQENVSET